ncbi:MAG: hypothetical protein NVS4B13_03460 [Candidatus Elarobacter sp.]
MTAHPVRLAACAMLPLLVLGGKAGAQTPEPSPSPAPTAVAFSAHAHASIIVVTQNGTFSGTALLGLAQHANQTRIDLLSIKSDALPIPPISLTVVIDRGANTLTAWSDTTRRYRVQPFLPRAAVRTTPPPNATPRPSATPRPPQGGTSPLSRLEVFAVTIKLTGHTTTIGIPSTGLAFDLQVRNTGDKALSHVTAATQMADEFPAFPLTLDVSVEPGAAPFSAKLAYAVDDVARGAEATTRFDVPAGYTEASSLLGVIFLGRAAPAPSPVPSPRR